jgi:hypothetical protein
VSGKPVDYRVRLGATNPNYGGLRWWSICPLARQDGGPPRRVAKLYSHPVESISEAARHTVLTAADTGLDEWIIRAGFK